MRDIAQRTINTTLLCITCIFAITTSAAFAQSGSAGGSIGNDEKSLSGSRSTPRAVESEKPARRNKPRAEPAEPRRASRTSGGGGGNFDGAWIVNSVGCGGTSRGAVVVTSGRIIGEGVSGTVSGSGGVRTVGNFSGVTVTSSGHLSGRNGSGAFRRSDGCNGSWTASKQ